MTVCWFDQHKADQDLGTKVAGCLQVGFRWESQVITAPRIDPSWWTTGSLDGQPIADILRRRDFQAVFRFLKKRGLSRAAIAAATGLSETRVRAIWNGKQQITSYDVLERVAHGLRIERGYVGLAYSDASAPQPIPAKEPVGYEDFIGTVAAIAMGSGSHDITQHLPTPPVPAELPSAMTDKQVDLLVGLTERHRQFDAERGGGSCRESAVAYLRWASAMRFTRFVSEQVERSFKAALSDLCQVAGWACHDVGDHIQARRYLTAGLALAREVQDLALIAGSFYRLGRVSIHQGRADEALKLWQLGQIVAQDSGCLVSVAVLHANEAWAYAILGQDERVRDSIARAEGELVRVDATSVPPWARFFCAPADIDGIAGVIYNSLALHPQHRSRYTSTAIDRSERAYERRRNGETRSRIFDAISLASAYLLDEQLDQAEKYGHTALDLLADVESRRVTDRLATVTTLARPHLTHSGIAALVERVDKLIS